uniref:Uncharacterized protein n=1 Tax=Rhizophora mucronata TaxID=61149 RepID=A0A2P2NGV0_RHIMU
MMQLYTTFLKFSGVLEFTIRKSSSVSMSSWDFPRLCLCCCRPFTWTSLGGGPFCCWAHL